MIVFNFVCIKYNLSDRILWFIHCFLLFFSTICSYVVLGVKKLYLLWMNYVRYKNLLILHWLSFCVLWNIFLLYVFLFLHQNDEYLPAIIWVGCFLPRVIMYLIHYTYEVLFYSFWGVESLRHKHLLLLWRRICLFVFYDSGWIVLQLCNHFFSDICRYFLTIF